MKLLRKLKNAKKGTIFLLIGNVFFIFFILLVLTQHLSLIRERNAFKTFTRDSEYKIVLTVGKQKNKRKLFDVGNYHFYGIGVQNIEIAYNGTNKNLKKIMKQEELSLTDFLENWHLVYTSPDQTIKKYESDTYELRLETISEEESEITIKKVS